MDLRFLILIMFHTVKLDDAGKCTINNCRHCISKDECSVCTLYWFGKTCEHKCQGTSSVCSLCSDSYLRNRSSQYTDEFCSGCKSNEFIFNDECRKCPANCIKCSGLNDCLECHSGYFGKSCRQCSPYCLKMGNTSEWCSMNGTCEHGCLKGKTGRMCDLNCERKDVCIECDQFSNRCMKCTNGWYGTNCNKTCGHCSPDDKGAIACDIVSGECRHGCTHGFFGTNCDIECSPGCHDQITNSNKCDKATGHCIFGCIPGLYGNKCDKNCSSHCSNNTCHRKTGHCENGCVREWYGLNCTYACSNTCLNQSCNVTSGYCDIGCEVGWYGDSCNDSCSIQCANQSCDRQSGQCYNAASNVGGIIVEHIPTQNCTGKCKNNACDKQTSWCLLGCEVGYEGPYCNKTMRQDFGAIVILTSCGIGGALIVLMCIFVICCAIRYALFPKPSTCRKMQSSNKDDIEPVYDVIGESADEMDILTKCTEEIAGFATIADSVFDTASCFKSTSKDNCYGKLADVQFRTNDYMYSGLACAPVNSAGNYVPRLSPSNKSFNASNDTMKDVLHSSDSIGSGDEPNEQYSSKDVNVEPSADMESDHCDYLHPVS